MDAQLSIHSVPDELAPDKAIAAAKALRLVYVRLDDETSLESCADIIAIAADSDGWMPVAADLDFGAAQRAAAAGNRAMIDASLPCRFAVNAEPDWMVARSAISRGDQPPNRVPEAEPSKVVALRKEDEQFSTQAYETALVLLCQTAGQPLTAAVAAGQLARTTGQPALYDEATRVLCKVFPWLPDAMQRQPSGVTPDAS